MRRVRIIKGTMREMAERNKEQDREREEMKKKMKKKLREEKIRKREETALPCKMSYFPPKTDPVAYTHSPAQICIHSWYLPS